MPDGLRNCAFGGACATKRTIQPIVSVSDLFKSYASGFQAALIRNAAKPHSALTRRDTSCATPTLYPLASTPAQTSRGSSTTIGISREVFAW